MTKTAKVLFIKCSINTMGYYEYDRFFSSLKRLRKEVERRGFRSSIQNNNVSGDLEIRIWKSEEGEFPKEERYQYNEVNYKFNTSYQQKMADQMFDQFFKQKQQYQKDFFSSYFNT